MKNKNYSIAKILILIPIVVSVITVICLVLASILEVPTARGTLYSFFALIGLLSLVLSPLPCLAMSVVGIIFSAKAMKEGIVKARIFFVIGIVELLPCILGLILAIAMFIGGQGV